MKKLILLIVASLFVHQVIGQSIPIFNWQDQLCYQSGISVAEGGGKVYCVSKGGVFIFNKGDNSIQRLSKVNGLSDVQATAVAYNSTVNKAIIAYKDGNVDIINGSTITNIPDIINQTNISSKLIYNIYCLNQYTYLACNFGIVKIDMNAQQVADTYIIGPNGTTLAVRDIASDSAYFYAATATGVSRALINSPNLADYHSWSAIPGLTTGIYSAVTCFQGMVWANHSLYLATQSVGYADEIKVYNGTSWSSPPANSGIQASGYTTRELRVYNNSMYWVTFSNVISFLPNYAPGGFYVGGNYPFGTLGVNPEWTVPDATGNIWIADDNYGLVSYRPIGGGFQYRYPNGPASNNVFAMSCGGGNLMVAPGGINLSYAGSFINDGVSFYSNNNWTADRGNSSSIVNFNTTLDIINVLIDTLNPNHAYAATFGEGVIEFLNGAPVNLYNTSNSSLQSAYNPPSNTSVFTAGLALDASSNLWVSNCLTSYGVSVKSPSGTWTKINMHNIISGGADLGQILIDSYDQKWITSPRGGGLIVLGAGVNTSLNSTNSKVLNTAKGNGALPSLNVYCMAEDQSGAIWVGTDQGITVFYSPQNIFASGQNFDSQQILLTQDGNVQILLLTELITCIAVDDANRKWIGTQSGGLFLMSADGTQQIYHFDASNSPLFSNNITSLAINHKTGEVFIGTAYGILEFRGSSIEGSQDYGSMYAFPNPVKPDYTGPIAITGLEGNSSVKITDVSGTLVYETTSLGGQAIWYGTNFKGQRVSTGVYLVFATSEDGKQKGVTKILFIN